MNRFRRSNKYLSFILAICLVLNMIGSIPIFAEGEQTSPEDITPPVIKVEGVADGQVVTESQLQFNVAVTDEVYESVQGNVYKNITPIVTLNDVEIDTVEFNEIDKTYDFTAELIEGENSIRIQATDEAENKAEENYTITYQPIVPPNIETTLKDMTTKADIITFDLWAKDGDGNKIAVSKINVTNNGKPVSVTWDDLEKTSYTLNLEVGTNNVEINIDYNGKNYTQKYTIIREDVADGEVIGSITFSLEAFTVGLGYLIEPIQVDIHKGRNAAQELDQIIRDNGYNYDNTGTLESGFYLSYLLDDTNTIYKTDPKIPDVLKEKLNGSYDETDYWDGELGEFNFNFMSGWMYAVNNTFPNVGFADKYLQDGDVMRVQFTLAYGSDIGGASAMGGGTGSGYFPKVDKDELTKKIAEINSSISREEYLSNNIVKDAYDNSIFVLQRLDASQQEIDEALLEINYALEVFEDTEAPVIMVKGLEDGATVTEKELSFNITVTDDLDEKVEPVVRHNGEILTGTDGTYYITLVDGENIITIEATDVAGNKKDATYKLIYNPIVNVETITIDKSEVELIEGENIKLNATITPANATNKNVTWTSENEEITTVDVNGKVTAIKEGIATITLTTEDGDKTATCTVTVNRKEIVEPLTVKEQIQKNLELILENTPNPSFGTGAGEWSVLSLARGEYPVPAGYYDIYYNNVVEKVKELMPKYGGKLHRAKGTEHSRLILGFSSIGRDITDVGAYDIRDALADFNYVTRQGINGPIFALIALDTYNYEIPVIEGVETQTTREMCINYILDKEIHKGTENAGGWALGGSTPDPDITAMAIQGLTPYYEKNEDVKAAVDRGLDWLSNAQKEDGGYSSWGSINSESIAQVVVATTGLGIDPHTDPRFVKNDNSAIDALMTFAVPSGGFMHVKPGGNTGGGADAGVVDGMATDQGTYALIAYDRFVEGKSRLYDMTDVFEKPTIEVEGLIDGKVLREAELKFTVSAKDSLNQNIIPVVRHNGEIITGTDGSYKIILSVGENTISIEATDIAGNRKDITYELTYTPTEEVEIPEGIDPVVEIPEDNEKDYKIPITAEDKEKEITINIPAEKKSKVLVDLPVNTPLPKIRALKGEISAIIPKGVKITSGDSSELEIITSKDIKDENIINKLKENISEDKKLDSIDQVFSMGGSKKIEFNDFITLTFKGLKGKDAAYIQDGKLNLIQKYASDELGRNSEKLEYAYDSDNDLIVKTKHFTDFIAYTASKVEDGDDNPGGGGTNPDPIPSKSYITLSIDKKTIGKGYTLSPTKVEITEGESVWDVLKREMDKRNIAYEYTFTPKYNSVYVEWIDGDGEFDHGSGSGWMYNVDGWYPNYGASVYKLTDGEVVQWRYTTNLGRDLGEDITKWDQPTITVEGIENNETFSEKEVTFKVTAKATYGPIKGEDATVTIKFNGKTITKSGGNYTITLKDGENNLEIIAIDSEGNRRDEAYKLIYNSSGVTNPNKPNSESGDIIVSKKDTLDKHEEEILKAKLEKVYKDVGLISTWAYTSIEKATELGFVEGFDGKLNPKGDITRAEFIKIIALALELDIEVENNIDFKDVNESDWFYPYINTAYKAGIIEGDGNNFNPNDNITREQMAVIVVRALGLEHQKPSKEIKDIEKVSNWAKKDVETVVAIELMTGNEGSFNPEELATREMAIVVAMRGYEIRLDIEDK